MPALALLGSVAGDMKIGIVLGLLFGMVSLVVVGRSTVAIASGREKLMSNDGFALAFFLGFAFMSFRSAYREYGFLTDYSYVEGVTTGAQRCGKSLGVGFDYVYKGLHYANCSSREDRTDIVLTGGHYWVRVWNGDAASGRIEFDRPVGAE